MKDILLPHFAEKVTEALRIFTYKIYRQYVAQSGF